MNKRTESKPTTVSENDTVPSGAVPFSASPAGDPGSICDWANGSVWTNRMLTTLVTGVRGGKWHALIDKVYKVENLFAAHRKVTGKNGAAGVDHVSCEEFDHRHPAELARLQSSLREETYVPQAIRRVNIPKPGSRETRPLGIPTVRDRVVQTALLHVIEPIFDNTFYEHSYGFRRQRGCKNALERVERLLDEGYVYVVDADLKSYFDTIDHTRLLTLVRAKISDRRVLSLIESYLKQGILEDLRVWEPEEGSPQGAVISPLLANIFLNPLDHLLAGEGYEVTRYADDFVIQCRTAEEAEAALTLVQQWTADVSLTLHPEKTKIVHVPDSEFDFLGYTFRSNNGRILRLPRTKSEAKFRDSIRRRTKRLRSGSMEAIIADVNEVTRGWFVYFRHSYPTVFRDYDGWIRRRLRSILRRRRKLRGISKKGKDHQRWPNAYFEAHGYYSLVTAHASYSQSSSR